MIRFIVIILFLIVYFIISLPFQLAELIIEKFNMDLRNRSSLFFVNCGFKIACSIAGVRLTVKGYENIPENQAVLFVGNHISLFDIIVTYPLMKKPTGFIAKKELKKIPFLSWWMYFVNCIFLDRKDPREGLKAILQASDYIKNGVSIFLFPEGTRSKDGKLHEFKDGGFKIATKVGAPIIPVGITGTSKLFENQFPKIRPAHVTVTFGTPIYTEGLSRSELKEVPALAHQQVADLLGQYTEPKQ